MDQEPAEFETRDTTPFAVWVSPHRSSCMDQEPAEFETRNTTLLAVWVSPHRPCTAPTLNKSTGTFLTEEHGDLTLLDMHAVVSETARPTCRFFRKACDVIADWLNLRLTVSRRFFR